MAQVDPERFICTSYETMAFFGVSAETLRVWVEKGAPKVSRGKWDIKALYEWRCGGGLEESPEARKLKADADLKEAKAAQERIKLSVARTEFAAVADVEAELKRLLANTKKSLLSVSHSVSSELATIDRDFAEVAKRKIDDTIADALTELSQGREYKIKAKRKKRGSR